ncbi:MAG: amidohydrolase [Oscillospiraceae bacterium]|nr:amidohydrolase [Oscillospiraceae bacterium]
MKTIYYNAKVYTGTLPLREAFIVENDTFIFSGSSAEALAQRGEQDTAIDLGGAFVCAGFNDSHMHLLGYGNTLMNARLEQHTQNLADVLQCLSDFAAHRTARTGWIVGRGWNQDYFTDEQRMPNRYDLDKVSTELPVCAVRACGHALAVNSKALELLGITAETPQVEGGEIDMENGEPSGLFFDNAMDLVYSSMTAPDKDTLKDMIRSACRALNAYGVTSCQSDDYCVFSALPWQRVNEAFLELETEGELTVRVYEQANFMDADSLRGFVDAGNRTGVGTDLFKIGPLKMLGDGALGPRTAFLSRPYADAADTCGIPVFSQETFDEMIGLANREGMQVAIHAIGDACLDRVLSAINKALSEHPRVDHRHGIVHCQITREDQLREIAAKKLHVYAQSIFLDYDIAIVTERVGTDRAATSYSWKTLMNLGATVSNGTDSPVEQPFALGGIQCSVTRSNLRNDIAPYLPHEAFTVQEALDSYTALGAFASFEEHIKGRIEPGMLADFVVLDTDPFAVDPHHIKDIHVLATYLGGRNVYSVT